MLRGHTGAILCVTVLSGGRLATGSGDETVRIWSPEGKELQVLKYMGEATHITALPDGCFVTCPHIGRALLWLPWLPKDEERLYWSPELEGLDVLHWHTYGFTCTTALPDGRLATGSWDGTVRLWSLEYEELHVLHGHTEQVLCITVLSDGRLATGSWDGTVRLWSPDLNALCGEQIEIAARERSKIDFRDLQKIAVQLRRGCGPGRGRGRGGGDLDSLSRVALAPLPSIVDHQKKKIKKTFFIKIYKKNIHTSLLF